jgi:hypothetical protein
VWDRLETDDAALIEARHAARKRHALDFEWEAVLEQYLHCFEQVMASPR